jgi:hypothetical protein
MNRDSERRREPRYQVGDGAMAVSANNSGHIQNISLRGISFYYLLGEIPVENGDTVDIMDGQHNFFMQAIPCRLVSKRVLIKATSISMMRMEFCSLEFGALSKSQKDELEAYVNYIQGQPNLGGSLSVNGARLISETWIFRRLWLIRKTFMNFCK